jgi:hypothetical protein
VAIAAFHAAAAAELKRTQASVYWQTWQLFWNNAFGSATAGTYVAPLTPFVFRGQKLSGQDLVPTLFRSLPPDEKAAEQELRRRDAQQDQFLNTILTDPRVAPSIPNHLTLSSEQKLAVARHYGYPSSFLDLTADFRIAAYFATRTAAPGPVIGVVYLVNLVDLMGLPGLGSTYVDHETGALAYDKMMNGVLDLTWQTPGARDIEWISGRIQFQESVHFALRLITVPGAHRIEAQKAVFLRLGRLRTPTPCIEDVRNAQSVWKILRFVAQKFCFFHTAGPYSEPSEGIGNEQLMPSDDPVERLVAAQRAA